MRLFGSARREQEDAKVHSEVRFWKGELDKCVNEKNYFISRAAKAERECEVLRAELAKVQQHLVSAETHTKLLQTTVTRQADVARQHPSLSPARPVPSPARPPMPPQTSSACSTPASKGPAGQAGLAHELESLRQQVALAVADARRADLEVAMAQERVASLTQELEKLRADKECLQRTIEAHAAEAAMLRKEVTAAQGLSESTADEASNLLAELSRAQQEISRMNSELQLKDSMVELLSQQLADLMAEKFGGMLDSGCRTPVEGALFSPLHSFAGSPAQAAGAAGTGQLSVPGSAEKALHALLSVSQALEAHKEALLVRLASPKGALGTLAGPDTARRASVDQSGTPTASEPSALQGPLSLLPPSSAEGPAGAPQAATTAGPAEEVQQPVASAADAVQLESPVEELPCLQPAGAPQEEVITAAGTQPVSGRASSTGEDRAFPGPGSPNAAQGRGGVVVAGRAANMQSWGGASSCLGEELYQPAEAAPGSPSAQGEGASGFSAHMQLAAVEEDEASLGVVVRVKGEAAEQEEEAQEQEQAAQLFSTPSKAAHGPEQQQQEAQEGPSTPGGETEAGVQGRGEEDGSQRRMTGDSVSSLLARFSAYGNLQGQSIYLPRPQGPHTFRASSLPKPVAHPCARTGISNVKKL